MVKLTLYNCFKKYDELSKTFVLCPTNKNYTIKIYDEDDNNFSFDIKTKNKIIFESKNSDRSIYPNSCEKTQRINAEKKITIRGNDENNELNIIYLKNFIKIKCDKSNFKKDLDEDNFFEKNYNDLIKIGLDTKEKFIEYKNFDWKTYIDIYIDLKKSGINDKNSAWIHWFNTGKNEGRCYDKKKLDIDKNFNWKMYLECNQDLLSAGINTKETTWIHWFYTGKNEGRKYKKKYEDEIHNKNLYEIYNEDNLKNTCILNSFNKLYDLFNYNYENIKLCFNIYIINNVIGGGSNKYLNDIINNFTKNNINFIFIRNVNEINKYSPLIKKNDILILQYILLTDIEFSDVINLIKKYELRLIIPIHDNYYMNNNPVYDRTYSYNIHQPYSYIPEYKMELLNLSEIIIFPSNYIYNEFYKLMDKNNDIIHKMFVVNHIDNINFDIYCQIPKITDCKINIGIITNINKIKGEKYYNQIFKIDSINNHKIIYYIYGEYLSKNINKFNNNVYFLNGYNENDIYDRLKNDNIHGLLFLNKYPETYCYALSKGINIHLPILYSDIGAIGERLNKYNANYYFKFDEKNDKNNFESFINYIISNNNQNYSENTFSNKIIINDIYNKIFTNNLNKNLISKIHKKIKPFAIYFPQFHEIKENNYNFYVGYTDMINLEKMYKNKEKILTPLKDILNFYDLAKNKQVIDTQIEIAKNYGFCGFGIYYYWFSDNSITNKNMIFEEVIDYFFLKKIDDFNVFFIYCNENWTDNVAFSKNTNSHVIKNYYTLENLKKNADNLINYFRNDNYYKIENKPVFCIHHPFEMTENEIDLLYDILNKVTIENGFDGIYLCLNCIKNKYEKYNNYFHHANYKTTKTIFNTIIENNRFINYEKYVNEYLELEKNNDDDSVINTLFTNFDNSPRFYEHKNKNTIITKTINNDFNLFSTFLDIQFKKYLSTKSEINKLFFVNAWNEWGEQMVMEPSNELGYKHLQIFYYKLIEYFGK